MISRHLIGDLGLAVLLSVPVSAIAATGHAVHDIKPATVANHAKQSPVEGRFTLLAPN